MISYSKTVNKQRVEFYLEKIQQCCCEMIDKGEDSDGDMGILELIRTSVDSIEQTQRQRFINRKNELENIMRELKSPIIP